MIGSSVNRISYNGNGIATEFAYTFKILEKSDIKVLHVATDGTEHLLTKDYYVDTEKSVVLYPGYAPGAEIPEQNRPPILPVGERIVLYREVPITQESALDKHWPFNVIENGLDKLTIICQQIWDRLQRSFYVSESTSTNFDPKVPIEAGKTFRVKDDGTGFEVTEDPGKVIDGATALLKQTTEQAESANEAATNAQNAADRAEQAVAELPSNWQDMVKKTDSFVTPEMFGAIGDGVTDDTIAIQQAIDSNSIVLFAKKTYKINSPIVISKSNYVLRADTCSFVYSGNDSAFKITKSENVSLYFNNVSAPNGRVLELKSTNTTDYVQYVNIFFNSFSALTDSIYGSASGSGWVNEIRLYNGRVVGINGINIDSTSSDEMTSWKFYSIGFEGVTNGVNINATKTVSNFQFLGCRYLESFTKLLKIKGLVWNFRFVGTSPVTSDMLDFSEATVRNFVFDAPYQVGDNIVTNNYIIDRTSKPIQVGNLNTTHINGLQNITSGTIENVHENASVTAVMESNPFMAKIALRIKANADINAWENICTLPTGFRQTSSKRQFCFVPRKNANVVFWFNSNGNISCEEQLLSGDDVVIDTTLLKTLVY